MKVSVNLGIPVWVFWIVFLIISIGCSFLFFTEIAHSATVSIAVFAVFIIQCLCAVFLTLRMFRFHVRIKAFFRKLLANDYSTGIRDLDWLDDELSSLTILINKAADQLRTYDNLRSERTGMSFRAMDLLFRNSDQGIIIADMEKKMFRFNPAAQEMYNVNQESYSYDTIERQDANSRFIRIFLLTTFRDAITKEGTAILQLPQRETARNINFRIEPLKNSAEKVRFAFIFISLAESMGEIGKNEFDSVQKTDESV